MPCAALIVVQGARRCSLFCPFSSLGDMMPSSPGCCPEGSAKKKKEEGGGRVAN